MTQKYDDSINVILIIIIIIRHGGACDVITHLRLDFVRTLESLEARLPLEMVTPPVAFGGPQNLGQI